MFSLRNAPLLHDTRQNVRQNASAKNLAGLVQNTTGQAAVVASVSGIITDTRRNEGKMNVHIPVRHIKTQPKTYGQVPYSGPNY
jgi:hypothetical protein